MAIYIVLVFLPLITKPLVSILPASKKTQDSVMLFISFGAMTVISAFRHIDVIVDTVSYHAHFVSATDFSLIDYLADKPASYGYYSLTWLVAGLGLSFHVYYLILYSFIYFVIAKWLLNNSPNVFLSLLIFGCLFFAGTLIFLRQTLALAFLLLFHMHPKQENHPRRYWLLVIAILMHTSALVCILYPVIRYFVHRQSNATIIIVAAFAGIMWIFRSSFLKLINAIGAMLNSSTYVKLDASGSGTFALMMFLVVLVTLIFLRRLRTAHWTNVMLIALICFGFGLTALGGGTIMRLTYYFTINICLLIPETLALTLEQKSRAVIIAVLVVLLLFMFTPSILSSTNLFEYRFFWQESSIAAAV